MRETLLDHEFDTTIRNPLEVCAQFKADAIAEGWHHKEADKVCEEAMNAGNFFDLCDELQQYYS